MTSRKDFAGWAAMALVAGIGVAALSVPATAEVTLYGAATNCAGCKGGAPSTLYTIDPVTAVATEVGPIVDSDGNEFLNVTGLAFMAFGKLVASASTDDGPCSPRPDPPARPVCVGILIEIDPETGVASLIGEIDHIRQSPQPLGAGSNHCGRFPDLTYDPTSEVLYAAGDQCFDIVQSDDTFCLPILYFPPGCASNTRDMFYRIDPETGEGTPVGRTGIHGQGNGLAWNPNSGVLYHASGDFNALYTVNPLGGDAVTVEGSTGNVAGDKGLAALDFHPVTLELYGALKDGNQSHLVTVEITDGTTTTIGEVVDGDGESIANLDALAFLGPNSCSAAPLNPDQCKLAADRRSKLTFAEKKGKQKWSWRGDATEISEFGDPLTDTDYWTCIYHTPERKSVLAHTQLIPAGSGWTGTSKGFKYKAKDGSPDGVTKLTLKAGKDGKARVKLKGEGVDIALPVQETLSQCALNCVQIQLVNDEDECWNSGFSFPFKHNRPDLFKGKN